MNAQLDIASIAKAWDIFQKVSPVHHIGSKKDYNHAVRVADALVDDGAMDKDHPQHSLFMTLCDLIHAYDQIHYPQQKVSGVAMLRFLMEQHGLTQSQLPEIGKQSVVSEILAGKRSLTVEHIRNLSGRFSVSPAVFFE